MSNSQQESPVDAFARFLSDHPGAEIVVSTDIWAHICIAAAEAGVVMDSDSIQRMIGVGVRVDSGLSPGTALAIDRKSVESLFVSERGREVSITAAAAENTGGSPQ